MRDVEHANELKQALEGLASVSLGVRTHDSGKLFGSVTVNDVVGAIKNAGGPAVDKRNVELPKGHIKTTGTLPGDREAAPERRRQLPELAVVAGKPHANEAAARLIPGGGFRSGSSVGAKPGSVGANPGSVGDGGRVPSSR